MSQRAKGPEPSTPALPRWRGRLEDWRTWPRRTLSFTRLAIDKARADELALKAASLAFITIISLVPLLAAFSFFGARFFKEYQEKAVEVLSHLLPYSEEALFVQLEVFLDQAQAIRGLGFALFLLTSLATFASIEETINRIWNVSQRRPLRSRLLSFTLLIFWGPMVIGATYWGLFVLRQNTPLRLADSLPAQLAPFLVTALALAMLYWLVPYTAVRFKSALVGGVCAALLLETLRGGFRFYVESFQHFSIIYGGFGLVLFFMISIQLTWWLVLLGCEAAYCTQNFALLVHPRQHAAPLEGSWLALVAMVVILDHFRQGQGLVSQELLAQRLRLNVTELHPILQPLVDGKLVYRAGASGEGYSLCCDPYEIEVKTLLGLYDHHHWKLLESLPEPSRDVLIQWRAQLQETRGRELEGLTLVELLRESETTSPGSDSIESLPSS